MYRCRSKEELTGLIKKNMTQVRRMQEQQNNLMISIPPAAGATERRDTVPAVQPGHVQGLSAVSDVVTSYLIILPDYRIQDEMQTQRQHPLVTHDGKLSFCLSNLMLTGVATPYLHNGEVGLKHHTLFLFLFLILYLFFLFLFSFFLLFVFFNLLSFSSSSPSSS